MKIKYEKGEGFGQRYQAISLISKAQTPDWNPADVDPPKLALVRVIGDLDEDPCTFDIDKSNLVTCQVI